MQAAVQEVSSYFIGKNPLLIEEHWQTLYRHGCYRGGPILMSLIAGIDQALWVSKANTIMRLSLN
jgi:galactonate dehydratase